MADFEWLRPGGHAALVAGAKTYAREVAADANNNVQKLAKTLTGTIVTASDAYAASPVNTTAYGTSTQDGTPSTLAPVPIESVDALTLCVAGRNLLDVVNGSATSNGITFTENTDGSVTVSGSTQSSSASLVINSSVRLLDGVTYTLSGCPENGGSSKWRLYYSGRAAHYDNGRGVTWTQSGDDVGPVYIRIYADQTVNFTFYPQLEIGPTATPYQPYVGTSTSIDLQGHELRSLPDGTCDELTLTPDGTEYRVTLTQRVGRVNLGTLTWTYSTTYEMTYATISDAAAGVRLTDSLTCDGYASYPSDTVANLQANMPDKSLSLRATYSILYVKDSAYTDAAAFKTAVSDVMLHYALATPATIDLGTVTLPDLPAPDMIVWANGGSAQPSLDVTYERDANMAESAIYADVDGLHDDVTELRTDTDGLRTDTDGLLANVAQIPSMLSQQLTAGAAGGITSGGPTDSAAWVERVTGGGDASDGPATIDAIRGRTVVWNQLAKHNYNNETHNGVTFNSNADGSVTITGTNTTTGNAYPSNLADNLPTGHVYLIKGVNTANAGIGGATGGYNLFLHYVDSTTSFAKQFGTSGLIITPSTSHTAWNLRIQVGNNPNITFNDTFYPQLFDLTLMFGAGNEPSTVAEFEALFPESYYPYDAGSLLPVRMEGVESMGLNKFVGPTIGYSLDSTTGAITPTNVNNWVHDRILVSESTITIVVNSKGGYGGSFGIACYGQNGKFIGVTSVTYFSGITTTPYSRVLNLITGTNWVIPYGWYGSGASYLSSAEVAVYDGSVATAYEPHWQQARAIPAATYFPNGMRSAGSVYDELTADAAVTRVGEVDLGTMTWAYDSANAYFTCTNLTTRAYGFSTLKCSKYETASSASTANLPDKQIVGGNGSVTLYLKDSDYTDAAAFKASLSGVMLHYALATPTTTPINPPLNLTYRAEQGGTERIAHTDPTAPPTLAITYGSTADGIRDRALSAIAPVEGEHASANYAVGSYLVHDGTLCKVTTAIASGEVVAIGTNVTATTVMAEVIALTQ